MDDTWDEYYASHYITESDLRAKRIASREAQARFKTVERLKKMTKTATIKRRDNAPAFVFGSFGYKYSDLKEFVNDKGYVNFDILATKDNTGYYVNINDYGLKQESTKKESDTVMNFDEDIEIPF